jgi:hypothetical protein
MNTQRKAFAESTSHTPFNIHLETLKCGIASHRHTVTVTVTDNVRGVAHESDNIWEQCWRRYSQHSSVVTHSCFALLSDNQWQLRRYTRFVRTGSVTLYLFRRQEKKKEGHPRARASNHSHACFVFASCAQMYMFIFEFVCVCVCLIFYVYMPLRTHKCVYAITRVYVC